MEIQGGLIDLEGGDSLPVPWQLRAFLGLQTGASVSLGVTRPTGSNPPDIILSPIALEKLPYAYKLIVVHREEKLSINRVLQQIQKFRRLNIAVADTVTIEGRTKHVSTMVLEPVESPPNPASGGDVLAQYEQQNAQTIQSVVEAINGEFGGETATAIRIQAPMEFITITPMSVTAGLVFNKEWHTFVLEYCGRRSIRSFDLNRLVCSGNTENYYIRYIFPARRATEISVSHRDLTGALHAVTTLIGESGYNVLASRLSRNPPPGYGTGVSNFVAICEPTEGEGANWEKLRANHEAQLEEGRNVMFAIGRPRHMRARAASKVTELHSRGRTIVMPAELLETRKRMVSRNPALDSSKTKVFLCYQFWGDQTTPNNVIVTTLRDIIEESNCVCVEASKDDRNQTTFDYIQTSLWMSDACLALAFNNDGSGALSPSQTHEIGFMQGQNKPFKIVVNRERLKAAHYGNLPDHQFIDYLGDESCVAPRSSHYIQPRIKTWLDTVKAERR